MKIKILLSSTLWLLFTINAQSVNDINELMDMYNDYKKSGVSSINEVQNTISNTSDLSTQLNKNYLIRPNDSVDTGRWLNRDDYEMWLEETGGDTSVRNLYGYIRHKSRYFGYNIFTKRDSIAIWPNVSIPDYYIIGPGDDIEVAIWGQAQIMSVLSINHDGYLYEPNIGKVYLEGKTLEETRNILTNLFSQKFSSLKGDQPSSFISVTLASLKSINVHFTGHVFVPGMHVLNPLSTIITGLFQIGGVDTLGTLRKIELIRNGKVFREVDIYDYLIRGDIKNEVLLQNNDVINIPSRVTTVRVDGQVLSEGIYETKEGETLADLLGFTGGINSKASDILTLTRIIPIENRQIDKPSFIYISINYKDLNKYECRDGDKLVINEIPKISNFVSISGKIKKPGKYVLTKDLTIKELLLKAGGIEDPEFLKEAYLDEIEILRVNEFKDEDIVIKMSLTDIINTNKYENFRLKKDDQIIIRENIFYRTGNLVEISGEVMVPGLYPIIKNNQSLNSVIQKAGGFTNLAFINGIEIYRGNKRLVWKNFDVPLISGDRINIPQKPGVVEVRGEVNNPGLIYYSKGRTLMSYVRSAGGLTSEGKRSNISIIYPNGNVKKRGVLPKTINEGCIIEVYKKSVRDPISLLAVVEQSVSIISSLALTYIAIQASK